jgi:hypothetical protein
MLIGREVESARLATALASARAGAGAAFVLVGEPGIGKTTLLRGLVDQAEQMTVLETAGVESEADLPYAALIDVLQPVLHRLDALPEAQAVALSTALALGPPGVVDRFAVGVATLGLLAAAAEDGLARRALVCGAASHGYPRHLRCRTTGRRTTSAWSARRARRSTRP